MISDIIAGLSNISLSKHLDIVVDGIVTVVGNTVNVVGTTSTVVGFTDPVVVIDGAIQING